MKSNITEKGKICSINYSTEKNTERVRLKKSKLIAGFGVEGDARGGSGSRHVSILSIESINNQSECPRATRKGAAFAPGDFGENITTEGIELSRIKIGDVLKLGSEVVIEVSHIGKKCYRYCDIYERIKDCVIPRKGMFAKVLRGGVVSAGDYIEAETGQGL